jgi:hypothetical protein
MKFRVATGCFLAIAAAVAAPAAIQAGEGDYIGLFGGSWLGSGVVVNDSRPWQVSCQAVGHPGINHLTIKGSCGVFLVNVPITADVRYDPSSGRYSGTYTGGDIAAHISGKRSGDTVSLDITWPKPINGDTKAHLIIVNAGNGTLRIVVDDNAADGGPDQTMSDLSLKRT